MGEGDTGGEGKLSFEMLKFLGIEPEAQLHKRSKGTMEMRDFIIHVIIRIAIFYILNFIKVIPKIKLLDLRS